MRFYQRLFLTFFCLFAVASAIRAAPVTVASITLPDYQMNGATCSLKLYASDSWTDSTGIRRIGGAVGSAQFFQTVAGTVADKVCTIPAFTLQSTTDAIDNANVRITAGIYDATGAKKGIYLDSFQVPISLGTAITWAQITVYNRTAARPPTPTFYNSADQINAVIQQQIANVSAPNATTVVPGKSALTAAPTNPNNPIAVGDRDPNYLALKQTPNAASYSSFATAVSSVAASFAAPNTSILAVSQSSNVTANLTVPPNISLKFDGTGTLNIASGVIVTIQNCAGIQAPNDQQIFSGAGKVLCTQSYPSAYYLEWFGGKNDGVTDNLAAWNKMQDSMANPKANVIYDRKGGGNVELSLGGTYYFSDTVRIRRGMHVYANGGERFAAGSGFYIQSCKAGVRVEGISTVDGTFDDPSQAGAWTRLENFSIISKGCTATNAIVDLSSSFVLTLKTGGQFTQASTRGQGSAAALVPGSTVFINGSIYTVPAGFGSDPTATIPLEKPRFSVTTYGTSNQFYLNGAYASNDWIGATVRLNGTIYTITGLVNASVVQINATINDSGIAEMQTIPAKTNQAARLNIYHGVIGLGTFDAKGIRIYGFAGNGLNLNSELYPTALLGNDPNVDLATFSNLSIEYSQGAGVTVFGVNSQPMNFQGVNNVENSRGWGFYEEGSSGVLLSTFHFNENAQGTYRIAGNVAHDVAIMPYTEGGQPGAVVGGTAIVINPIEGAATQVDSVAGSNNVLEGRNGQIHSRSGWLFTRPVGNFAATYNPKSFMVQIGNSQAAGVLLGFGGGEEAANAGSSPLNDPRVPAWILGYDQYKPGHYTLGFNADGSSLTSAGGAAIELSGSTASEGGGNLFFPRGFSVGKFYSGTERTWNYVSAIPASGIVRLGDIFWNNAANAGLTAPLGWVVSTAGTIGSTAVLTPFGNQSDFNLKANLASPTFTGTPSAPTATTGTNTTQIATTQFTQNQFAANILFNSASLDFPSTAATGGQSVLTITVTGAVSGDSCTATPNGLPETGLTWNCSITAANTASVRLSNITGAAIDPAARSYKISVFK